MVALARPSPLPTPTATSTPTPTPAYDAEGNTTRMPRADDPAAAQLAQYDAWNRLVWLKHEDPSGGGMAGFSAAPRVANYAYDALGRRVIEREYDTITEKLTHQDTILYSRHWQRLETRRHLPQGGTNNPLGTAQLHRQHVWHAPAIAYVDQICEQKTDTTGNGVLDETLYPLQDAMYNVVAAVDDSAAVQYRLAYSLYGEVETLDIEYDAATRPVGNLIAQQGLLIGVDKIYDNRRRPRYFRLGRYLQEDPIGYVDGLNLYGCHQITHGQPDPSGFKVHWASGEFCNRSRDMCAIVWRDAKGGRKRNVVVKAGECILEKDDKEGDVVDYIYSDGEWHKISALFFDEIAYLEDRRFCIEWSYKKTKRGTKKDKCINYAYAPFNRKGRSRVMLPLGREYKRLPWKKPWTPSGTSQRTSVKVCEEYCKCNLASKNRGDRDDCGSMKDCMAKCRR